VKLKGDDLVFIRNQFRYAEVSLSIGESRKAGGFGILGHAESIRTKVANAGDDASPFTDL
jgi:hypothetical protein